MTHTKMLLAGVAGALTVVRADAGPLTIAPTTLEIAPSRQSAMLSITNDSDEPVDLQFRAYAWRQPDGGEALLPTGDLVISPAIVTVQPRQRQVFRVLRVRTGPPAIEQSYRLRLNELPRPGTGGVAINLEFSLPVFVTAAGSAPVLSWRREGGVVTIANTGNRRVRLGALTLVAPDGRASAIGGTAATYILAGARRSFALPAGAATPAGTRLVGDGDTGRIDVADGMSLPR